MGIARADGYDCRCRMRISEGEMMASRKAKKRAALDFRIWAKGIRKGSGKTPKQYARDTGIDLEASYRSILRRVK